jgi:hypothetical protein
MALVTRSLRRFIFLGLAGLMVLQVPADGWAANRLDPAAEQARREAFLPRIKAMQQQKMMEKARLRLAKARDDARARMRSRSELSPAPGKRQRRAFPIDGNIPFSPEHRAQMARRLDAQGGPSALAPNVLANDTTENQVTGAGQAEQMIAAWGPYVLVAWNDGQGFEEGISADIQGYGYSTDFGQTFVPGGDLPAPANGWVWTSDPVVTVNEKTGEFYYLALINTENNTQNGIGIIRGTFSGTTFTWGAPHIIVSGSNSTVFYDKLWAVADSSSGRLYLTNTRFFGVVNEIQFRRTTGSWNSWSAPSPMNDVTSNGFVQGSRPAVGPAGEVYVTWKEIGPVDADFMKLRKSVNQGGAFGGIAEAAIVYDNFGTGAPGFNRERGITFPSIAVDRSTGPNRGRVYIAWNECINWYKDLGPIGANGPVDEAEPNNAPSIANVFVPGDSIRGTFSGGNLDEDFYAFSATQGTTYTFWCNDIPTSLYSMRIICTDERTRLNLAGDLLEPANGQNGFIVWTCPASGTYYLRMFYVNISGSTPGPYNILTGANTVGPEPSRDHRDLFVVSAPNGIGFGTPVRVNNDPPYFDNWLPEIAVAADGSVYVFWYGWHEATATACGGESHCYLARSTNGGQTWLQTGRVTETLSAWSAPGSFTNIQPNQGDYIGLYANETVYTAWADNRNGNADTYVSVLPTSVTPVLVSLASANAFPDHVTVTWYSASSEVNEAYVYRLEDDEWLLKGAVTRTGSGQLIYEDRDVTPGKRYAYRLGVRDGTIERFMGEVSIVVPSRFTLRIDGVRPNPTDRDVWVSFTLPVDGSATLSLVDVTGRRVRFREVGSLGRGRHVLDLAEGELLPAGVYIVRLEQGGKASSKRVSVVR